MNHRFVDNPSALHEHEIECKGGIWKIRVRGDQVSVVDPQGRERHRSRGQAQTACHVAMLLDERPFLSTLTADEALRLGAERFRTGDEA